LTKSGPRVSGIQLPAGDPEAQAILARTDFDLAEILSELWRQTASSRQKLHWRHGAAACVVLTSGGYSGKFENRQKINGLNQCEQITGVKGPACRTKLAAGAVLTNGGRVLGVTGGSALAEGRSGFSAL